MRFFFAFFCLFLLSLALSLNISWSGVFTSRKDESFFRSPGIDSSTVLSSFPCFWNVPHSPSSLHWTTITQLALGTPAPSLQPGEGPFGLPDGLVASGSPTIQVMVSRPNIAELLLHPSWKVSPPGIKNLQTRRVQVAKTDGSECSTSEPPSQVPEKALGRCLY